MQQEAPGPRRHPVSQATLDILTHATDAGRDAEICSRAVAYRVTFFVGCGHYERAATFGLKDARDLAVQMKAAYPSISGHPLIYAIDDTGRAALIIDKAA